jgi:hypothetical protein
MSTLRAALVTVAGVLLVLLLLAAFGAQVGLATMLVLAGLALAAFVLLRLANRSDG